VWCRTRQEYENAVKARRKKIKQTIAKVKLLNGKQAKLTSTKPDLYHLDSILPQIALHMLY